MFSIQTMLQKALVRAIQGVIAVLLAKGVNLEALGISVNPYALALAAVPVLFGLLEAARNFAKVKLGIKWL